MTNASNSSVKPLSDRAQRTGTCLIPHPLQVTRGTRACRACPGEGRGRLRAERSSGAARSSLRCRRPDSPQRRIPGRRTGCPGRSPGGCPAAWPRRRIRSSSPPTAARCPAPSQTSRCHASQLLLPSGVAAVIKDRIGGAAPKPPGSLTHDDVPSVPVYGGCAVQPGTTMTAHGDEVRCPTGAGPFFSSGAPSAHRPGDADPGAEPNLSMRYPTHPKQRGGSNFQLQRPLARLCLLKTAGFHKSQDLPGHHATDILSYYRRIEIRK